MNARIASETELLERIRHDGEMMKIVQKQRDAARVERDEYQRKYVALLIESNRATATRKET